MATWNGEAVINWYKVGEIEASPSTSIIYFDFIHFPNACLADGQTVRKKRSWPPPAYLGVYGGWSRLSSVEQPTPIWPDSKLDGSFMSIQAPSIATYGEA